MALDAYDGIEWLSDINLPLVIKDKSWKARQQQLKALPKWFYEPPTHVKQILLYLRNEGPDVGELTDDDWQDVRDHLAVDAVAFIWFFCFLNDRNSRRKQLATPTAPQLALLWRFMYLVDADVPVRMSVLKERQGGFSWVICMLVLWLICNNQHLNALHVAHDKKTTQRIFTYLKKGHEWLVDEVRPMKGASSKNELELANPDEEARRMGDEGQDSRAYVDTAGNDFAGTAEPVQIAHVSEVGKWDKLCDPETIWTSFANAMQDEAGTFIFAESTAHGAQTFWHKHWLDSEKMGEEGWNGFTAVFLPWYLDERNVKPVPPLMKLGDSDRHEYGNEVALMETFDLSMEQMAWRRRAIDKQASGRPKVESFNQEHPGTPEIAWLFAHGRWLPTSMLEIAAARCKMEMEKGTLRPIFIGDVNPCREDGRDLPALLTGDQNKWLTRRALGCLVIYRWPDWRYDYLLSADVAEGIAGGDNSCAKMWQRQPSPSDGGRPMRLSAEYYGLVGEDIFADILWRLGWFYSTGTGKKRIPAMLAWERTGPGRTISLWLRKGKTSVDGYPHQRMYRRHEPDVAGFGQDSHYGISTNRATKPVMMGALEKALRDGDIQLTASDIREIGTVTRDDRGHLETNGKDRTMACALGVYANLFSHTMSGEEDKPEEALIEHSVKWTIAKSRGEVTDYNDEETDEVALT